MAATLSWQQRIGNQRDWIWRGWQTRYTFIRAGVTAKNKPPLLLLHGFGASIEHWRNNIPVLSQQYTVYALDLLGFGASRKANTNYTVDIWVEQVADFWQLFIGQPLVLVGNSLGSLVSMSLAARYPYIVKGIVMLSLPDVSLRQAALPAAIAPVVTTIENIFTPPILLKTLFRFLRKPTTIQRIVQLAYQHQAAVTDELVEILAAPARDRGAAKTFCALFRAIRKPEFAPAAMATLPNLDLPILLVWGRQDRVVSSTLAPKFAALNPQIELLELDNMGHCPHDELPEQFNSLLLTWLAEQFA